MKRVLVHKRLAIFVSLVVLLLLVVSCATPSSQPTSSSAAPSVAPQKTFDIKFQSIYPPGSPTFLQINDWLVAGMKKATNGRINIIHSGSNSIVPDGEMFTAVKDGTLPMGQVIAHLMDKTIPVLGLSYGLPGEYVNKWEQIELLNQRLNGIFREVYSGYNIYYIAQQVECAKDLGLKKPANRLSELKGRKLRAGGSYGDMLRDLGGATLVTVAFSDIYTAASSGVIDGFIWGDIMLAEEYGFIETLDYYIQPSLGAGGGGTDILLNMDLWKSIPEELQSIFQNVVTLWAHEYPTLRTPAWQTIQRFTKRGGKIIYWPKEDTKTISDWSIKKLDEYAARDPKYAGEVVGLVKNMMTYR